MASKNFSYDDFIRFKNVPRETFVRLQGYCDLINKWQATINLIGNATLPEVWNRHIIDSTQLIEYIEPEDNVADVGSGAGFPGLVIAILGMKKVTLIESDARKSAFLREAARVTQTFVSILHSRVEVVDLKPYNVITARAFAPLPPMLGLLGGTLTPSHKLLLLKGKSYRSELQEARSGWSFDYETFPSVTDKDAVILSLTNIQKARAS